MKRYIRSDADMMNSNEIAYEIESQLEERGLLNALKNYDISPKSSVSCEAIAYLSNKYHGKKVRELIKYKNASEGIEHFLHQIETYVNTGYTMTEDDAYVYMLNVNDQPVGYIGSKQASRGNNWVYIYDDPKSRRVQRMERNKSFQLPLEYIGSGFDLIESLRGYDIGKYYRMANNYLDIIVHSDTVRVDKIKLVDAVHLSSQDTIDNMLPYWEEVSSIKELYSEYA